jgi:glycosyltransferase involved in cell wall biosynthesis
VCFVAPGAYGALAGRPDLRHIGGAEVQQRLLGRELRRRGFEVSFVTLDHGQPDGVRHDGIRVFKTCRGEDGMPGLRFLHPRWTRLWRALGRADADVYYQRGAGVETGQVALWSGRRGRPFVFAASSDTNADPALPDLGAARERVLYRLGLRRASRVVCQNRSQQAAFRSVFGVDADLVRSCAEDPLRGAALPARAESGPASPRVLWVGRIHPQKRFELLLEVAEACPELPFDVVGGRATDSAYAAALSERARALPNVTLHGWVAPDEVGRFYDRASVLVCTSPVEGFPNTFLEAWARGVPTVSTVDPDELVAREGLGALGSDAAALAAGLRGLHASAAAWWACARRARRHFLAHHTVESVGNVYAALFMDLAGRRRAAA